MKAKLHSTPPSISDFRLLETMRVSTVGDVYLLGRHLERLRDSARYFGFECNLQQIADMISNSITKAIKPACLRLLLSYNGSCELEFSPLPSGKLRRLQLSAIRVDSRDPFIHHKTSNRQIYDEARKRCDAWTEPLLVNERGEVTETSIANIALKRGTRWVTPRVSCGLLPGTLRAELLAVGDIVEGIVCINELAEGEKVRCFNSVRGIFDLPLLLSECGER